MSNVQECIDLYLTDDKVSDMWFRAMMRHAHEQDAGEPTTNGTGALLRLARVVDAISDQVEAQGKGQVLLNRIDNLRRDQIEDLRKAIDALTGLVDSHNGGLRVLRERLDNMEGK